MLYKEFYSELGKLLYAISDIDHVITEKEKKVLLDIVRKELAPAEKHKDSFGTDVAYFTEIEFEFLDETIADSESAFESFIDFIQDHHTGFNEPMKKVCLHVAKELASSYRGTSAKEEQLIEKLNVVLKKLKFTKKK